MKCLERLIRTIPDYPKPGIMFRDITTLLGDAKGLKKAIKAMAEPFEDAKVDAVAGIEARGFILGGAIADRLGCGFIPIRKKGKLPWKTIGQEYALEYGVDIIEMHEDAIAQDQRILVVDDLIATGGTAEAAIKLVKRSGGKIVGATFVIDLPDLGGVKRLERRAMSNPLPPERLPAALAFISAWRFNPEQPAVCPVCSAAGLNIIDRSARPYAEWYALICRACDLDHTIHIPLAPPQ